MEAAKYSTRRDKATAKVAEDDDESFPELSDAPDEVSLDTGRMATDRVLLRNLPVANVVAMDHAKFKKSVRLIR